MPGMSSLRPRRPKDDKPSQITCTGTKKVPKTRAEIQKAYRERLKKSDKQAYIDHRKDEALRCRIWRANRTEQQKAHDRELSKLRMRNYRLKKANQTKQSRPQKKMTRAEKKIQTEKWKEAKRRQRANMTAQKRRRINERRRQVYAEKKKTTLSPSVTRNFKTNDAKRKAVSRAWRVLPKNAEKFADVVSSVVQKSTPTKRKALEEKCILGPSKKSRLEFLEKNSVKSVLDTIRKSRKNRDIRLRRMLHKAVCIKNKLKKKIAHERLGISWNFLNKKTFQQEVDYRKKRRDATSDVIQKRVVNFYHRNDISREVPTASNSHKVLECTMQCAHAQFLEENQDVTMSFSTFSKLRPKNIKTMSNTTLMQCLCEYCINVEFKLQALTAKCAQAGLQKVAIHNKYEASGKTLCAKSGLFPDKKCIDRTCNKCGVQRIVEHFKPLLDDHGTVEVKWKTWVSVSGKQQKRHMELKELTGTTSALVDQLVSDLVPFSKHLTNARWQSQEFEYIRSHVPKDWVVLCMDFGENYNCHFQDEAQSAHWSYNQATIHPVVAYHQCPEPDCSEVMHQSLIFITDDRIHDQSAVQHFVSMTNQHLLAQGLQIHHQVQFSDGAGSQYKSKINFADASSSQVDFGFTVEKHFFGSRHGKGPCDGEIGVLKRCATTEVKARRVIISDANDLYKFGKDKLTMMKEDSVTHHVHAKRTFFFVKEGEIKHDCKERNQTLKPVPGTKSKHSFRFPQPFIVSARERSCFCETCIGTTGGKCANLDFTNDWEQFSLRQTQKGMKTGEKVTKMGKDKKARNGTKTRNDTKARNGAKTNKARKQNTKILRGREADQSAVAGKRHVTDTPTEQAEVTGMTHLADTPSQRAEVADTSHGPDTSNADTPSLQAEVADTSHGPDTPSEQAEVVGTSADAVTPSLQAEVVGTSPEADTPTEQATRDGTGGHASFHNGDFVAVVLCGKQSFRTYMAEIAAQPEEGDEDIYVKFMKKCGENLYMWPQQDDYSWEPKQNILCRLGFPELANKREQFRFSPEDMEKVKHYAKNFKTVQFT